ncbi:MAG: methylglyoxal synthase [Sebaldella sp.]|nr:methylglyoxal synthase [Sebaldella sp.]
MKKVALIAHDKKKDNLLEFVKENIEFFRKYELVGTGTTGKLISEILGLEVKRYQSGPLGGDQQIGALIAEDQIEFVMFFRDPLTSQPHEPDVQALTRLCDVHKIAIATNISTAKLIVQGYKYEETK